MAVGVYWAGQANWQFEPTFRSQALEVITGVAGAAHNAATTGAVGVVGVVGATAAAAGLATTVVHRSPVKPGLHELHTPILPNAAQPLLVSLVQTVPHPVGTTELVICRAGGEGRGVDWSRLFWAFQEVVL